MPGERLSLTQMAIVQMAKDFFGKEYPDTGEGYRKAVVNLQEQHAKIKPPEDQLLRATQAVAHQDPLVKTTEQMGMIALEAEELDAALLCANYLFIFGETDYQDSLGKGEAFSLSLRFHRAFAERLVERSPAKSVFLGVAGRQVMEDAKRNGELGDPHKELGLLRGMIHMAALEGALGPKAREQFDPMALLETV